MWLIMAEDLQIKGHAKKVQEKNFEDKQIN